MCYPVRCRRCGKTTWAGCGQHAENVMESMPPNQRCVCRNAAVGSRLSSCAATNPAAAYRILLRDAWGVWGV
nr:hypothetical protein [Mycobacterium haemophilum]